MNRKLVDVDYDAKVHLAVITLNEPDRLNPLGHEPGGMQDQLYEALKEVDSNSAVRCVVLTGAGRAFSSGADLSEGAGPRDGSGVGTEPIEIHLSVERRKVLVGAIADMRKPVIAAINGICYGAALMIAAVCDLRIAAESARFGLLEARMGASGVEPFPFLIGVQWSKYLILTGETIGARRARDIGLVLEVYSDDELMERVRDLGRRISSMPPNSVFLNRRLVDASMDVMGLSVNRTVSRPYTTLVQMAAAEASTIDGVRLRDIWQSEGFRAFKKARDKPFEPPWLPD